MSHLANNGSIQVLVLNQDKTSTKYVANKNGTVEVLTCATATFKAKYPEVTTDAQATKEAATKMLNPPKGLKLTNAAIAALKPISTTLVSESNAMKPSKPSAPAKTVAAPTKGTKVSAAPTKVPVAPKEAKEPKTSKAKDYDDNAKIKLLVKENPKREGSKAHEAFQGYFGAKTVAEALANGVNRSSIAWDAKHGYIQVEGWDVPVIEKKVKAEA